MTRGVELELLPALKKLGMRFYAYNPLVRNDFGLQVEVAVQGDFEFTIEVKVGVEFGFSAEGDKLKLKFQTST